MRSEPYTTDLPNLIFCIVFYCSLLYVLQKVKTTLLTYSNEYYNLYKKTKQKKVIKGKKQTNNQGEDR